MDLDNTLQSKENMLPTKYSLVEFQHFIFTTKQNKYFIINHPLNYQTYRNFHSSLCTNNFSIDSNYHDKVEPVPSSLFKSIWIAYASLSATNSKHLSESSIELKSSQTVKPDSQAVRLLLKELLYKRGLRLVSKKDISLSLLAQTYLDETVFPYRLQPQGYYVCFSHSYPIVACAISLDRPIGIDVEMREITLSVAKRFYHPDEVLWLNKQSSATQKLALKILWLIKEAYVKQQSLPTLMFGLKVNQLHLVKLLLLHLTNHDNGNNELVNVIYLESPLQVLTPYLYKDIDFINIRFSPSYSTLIYFATLPMIVLL